MVREATISTIETYVIPNELIASAMIQARKMDA
jgi:hypothetical protein